MMKKAITIILAFCLCNLLLAQSIVKGEYFFDQKREYGNGIPITINNPNGNLTLDLNISIDTLSEGLHRLFVRFKDSNDKWGQTFSYDILIKRESEQGIIYGEYFFDKNVEYGDGHALNLTTPAKVTEILDSLPVDTLSEGLHHLFVRFKDSEGLWSHTFRFNVLVKHNSLHYIVGGEYFFDTLVEYGDGIELDVDSLTAITSSSGTINAPSNLPPGQHTMFYRFIDSQGFWSQTFNEVVCVNVLNGKYTTDTTSYCYGDTVMFLYSGSITQNATYNWDLNDNGSYLDWQSNGSEFSYIPTVIENDTAIFRYQINSTLCSAWTKEDSLKVHVSPEITIGQTVTDASCFGDCNGALDITIGGGIGPFTYNWDDGSTLQDLNGLCADQYRVTATDAFGCIGVDSFLVNEPPAISIIVDAIGNEVGGQGNGFAEISASGGTPPYNFEWRLNGVVASNQEDPAGLSAGNYQLIIVDDNGCEDSTSVIIDNVLGLLDEQSNSGFDVYPNPAERTFNLKSLNHDIIVQVRLHDINGRLIHTEKHSSAFITIDLDGLPNGKYFLLVNDERGMHHLIALVKA